MKIIVHTINSLLPGLVSNISRDLAIIILESSVNNFILHNCAEAQKNKHYIINRNGVIIKELL